MPVPKRRHSRSRSRKKRTHWVAGIKAKSRCPKCGSVKLPHRACVSCGFYKDIPVIQIVEKSKE